MAKRRHTAEQIIIKLREAEVTLAKGQPLAQVVRKLGITAKSCYTACHCIDPLPYVRRRRAVANPSL